MQRIDYILDFCKELGKEMIACGANIERVDLSIEKIMHAYGLHDVTTANLTTRISISAKDDEKNYAHRQTDVPAQEINLEKLKKLNNLSYKVRETTPDPTTLYDLLHGIKTNDFPWWAIMCGFMVAMAGLARIFNAGLMEILFVEINTLLIFFLNKLCSKIKLNKIITNFVSMFLASSIAILGYYSGVLQSFYVVVITNAFYLIPGIQMVNCARNLLCGNEQNGVIELLKILLEICTIVAGVAAAYAAFGGLVGEVLLENDLSMMANEMTFAKAAELTVLTLMASTGFSVVFNVQLKDILFAAIGGTIIRICYICFQLLLPDNRFVFTLLAAFCAALYSEILANIRKEPSTLYLYPSIIPLIPGDLLYYVGLGIIWQNPTFLGYGKDLAFALLGISVGFVCCSSFVHYVRRFKFAKINKNNQ